MNIYIRIISVLIVLTAALSGIGTVMSQHPASPHQHESKPDQKRAAEVNQRGDRVMGFDHKKTTHRFALTSDGGVIEVTANDAADVSSKDQIVSHLSHIAIMFAEGNFESPMLIHDQVPPGVPVMQRLKTRITYKFEPTEHGGRVNVSTNDPEALKAIHDFLRFQIADHHTGDPTEVSHAHP